MPSTKKIILIIAGIALVLIVLMACVFGYLNHLKHKYIDDRYNDIVNEAIDNVRQPGDDVTDIEEIGVDDGLTETIPAAAFVGTTYEGSGYGGGLAIDMNIKFEKHGECICTSDWYQAYATPKELRGTYTVNDNYVTVYCNNITFKFTSDGNRLYYDNSDYESGGTIGLDYMTLTRSY